MDVELFFLITSQISATTILFFFFLFPFSATWLLQFIFSLSSIPHNLGNLVATIGKSHSGTPTGALHRQCLGSGMNFDNTITEIHFFSLLVTSLNFLLETVYQYWLVSKYIVILFFLREFQPMVSAFNDSSIIRLRNQSGFGVGGN